jgi:hypothetical protein
MARSPYRNPGALTPPADNPVAHNGLRNASYRNEDGLKWCSFGKHYVDPERFAQNLRYSDGLLNRCRDCDTEYRRAYRARLRQDQGRLNPEGEP